MKAVTVKQPPVSDGAVSVVPHDFQGKALGLAINCHRAGDISKLFVMVLVGGFQPDEILPAPGFSGHGPGHGPDLHITVKIKKRQRRPVLSVYLDTVESSSLLVPHLTLETDRHTFMGSVGVRDTPPPLHPPHSDSDWTRAVSGWRWCSSKPTSGR